MFNIFIKAYEEMNLKTNVNLPVEWNKKYKNKGIEMDEYCYNE